MFFFKGVIWLLVAAAAGVVPTVSLASFSYISLLFSFDVQVFVLLDLNGMFWKRFFSFLETRNIDWVRIRTKYQNHLALYVLVCCTWEGYQFL